LNYQLCFEGLINLFRGSYLLKKYLNERRTRNCDFRAQYIIIKFEKRVKYLNFKCLFIPFKLVENLNQKFFKPGLEIDFEL
jgi:hypothetical protein